ncbi:AfsR/SARP family transcriptional regulator [Kitasatospora phosalacinea]|uniref:AfsR/SARP family transcriptional regulator n=1 Tax=Kitasatospora phosalacinea TaxID=2065 RepID=UPI0007C478F9|nr:helix-turn-helix domain-containing protein [Kitasatospora phosalacinea]
MRGPLLLCRGRDTVPVESPTLRRLLGLLALTHPAAATRQEITDTLWPPGPPDSQQSLIHTHVSRLRRLLTPDDPPNGVLRTPTGYRLGLPRHRTDLGRFDDLLARTTNLQHAPDPDTAHRDLTRALRHWRGLARSAPSPASPTASPPDPGPPHSAPNKAKAPGRWPGALQWSG